MTAGKIERELKRRLRMVFDKMDKPLAEAEIFILSDKEMSSLRDDLAVRPDFKGREARKIKKEKHVNVLSFPESEGFIYPDSQKKQRLGEIYINGDMATDLDQLTYLLIHGALHLLGYMHYGKRDTMSMEKLEKNLWHHVFS